MENEERINPDGLRRAPNRINEGWQHVEGQTEGDVLRRWVYHAIMLDRNITEMDIADEIGVTRQRVSQMLQALSNPRKTVKSRELIQMRLDKALTDITERNHRLEHYGCKDTTCVVINSVGREDGRSRKLAKQLVKEFVNGD